MANKSQDVRRASKKPAGKTYGGTKQKTAYQQGRDAYKAQSKHKRGLTESFPRGC